LALTTKNNETWQRNYLDLDEYEERGLCQRIIQFSLRLLEKDERFEDDYAAIVQIKEWGSRINDWGDQDLLEFCEIQGMSTSGDRNDRKARVQNWMKMDINAAKAELAKCDAAAEPSNAFVVVARDDDPDNWSPVRSLLSCSLSPFSESFFIHGKALPRDPKARLFSTCSRETLKEKRANCSIDRLHVIL
jgi:hypothetical protein